MCDEHAAGDLAADPAAARGLALQRRHVLGLLGIGAVSAACGSGAREAGPAAAPTTSGGAPLAPESTRSQAPDLAVDPPGPLEAALLSADVLVYSQDSLDADAVGRIRAIKDVDVVEQIAMGSFYADDRQVTYAAVDPATFRRFTVQGTAQTQEVWDRVAGGEIAVEPKLGRQLQDAEGNLSISNDEDAQKIHIGAFATLLDPSRARRIDAVVNLKWAEELRMQTGNAALLGMGSPSPQSIRKELNRIAGDKASVQILGPDLDLDAAQTAILVGGSVSQAVGSFSYTANPDGTVNPDPAWIRANIASMEMPIIGSVTGHRVMLPQLRAALNDVVAAGLSKEIYTYDGCYVPRFIASDPSRGLSFHTFGTAIDLNAADNYRGIAGAMDRTVVAIFKRWGFGWGGDWNYTDPMHFELAKLVEAA
jgi:hypothetical protein